MNSKLYGHLTLIAFLGTASLLHAHPGHEGNDLTWTFSHGVSNFLPLLILILVVAARGWQLRRH